MATSSPPPPVRSFNAEMDMIVKSVNDAPLIFIDFFFFQYSSPPIPGRQDEIRLFSTTNVKERQAYDNMSELYCIAEMHSI